jgi:hypothetical protein
MDTVKKFSESAQLPFDYISYVIQTNSAKDNALVALIVFAQLGTSWALYKYNVSVTPVWNINPFTWKANISLFEFKIGKFSLIVNGTIIATIIGAKILGKTVESVLS